MSLTATVVHHVPGRMRLRLAAAKGDPDKLDEFKQSVQKLPDVRGVSISATLGTVIVDYEPSQFADFPQSLITHAEKEGRFTIDDAFIHNFWPDISATERGVERLLGSVSHTVQRATMSTINLKELFPFGLVAYALLFVDRAIASAQWLNWLQFAFSAYVELHQDEPVAAVGHSVEALRGELAATSRELAHRLEAIEKHLAAIAARNPPAG